MGICFETGLIQYFGKSLSSALTLSFNYFQQRVNIYDSADHALAYQYKTSNPTLKLKYNYLINKNCNLGLNMVFVLISSFVGILVTLLLGFFATKYFKPNLFYLTFILFAFCGTKHSLFAQISKPDSLQIPTDSIGLSKPNNSLRSKKVIRKSSIDSSFVDTTKRLNLTKSVVSYTHPIGSKLLFSDSLARWNLVNSASEFLYWNTGSQHFRTSSFLRSSYSLFPAQFEKEWRIDGLVQRNTLGNRINSNLLSFKRLVQLWLDYLGDFSIYTKRYYLAKPVTVLEAEEGYYGYLNVFGSFAAPITQQQSIELSLWNRSEDDEYLNSSTQAKNMTLFYRYQINDYRQFEIHAE